MATINKYSYMYMYVMTMLSLPYLCLQMLCRTGNENSFVYFSVCRLPSLVHTVTSVNLLLTPSLLKMS